MHIIELAAALHRGENQFGVGAISTTVVIVALGPAVTAVSVAVTRPLPLLSVARAAEKRGARRGVASKGRDDLVGRGDPLINSKDKSLGVAVVSCNLGTRAD